MLPLATPCPTHYISIKGSKICLLRNIQQLGVHFCVYVYAHVSSYTFLCVVYACVFWPSIVSSCGYLSDLVF